jgi:siroheme synthase-like protein
VYADAEAAGVWVNSADDVAHCSFILPSVHRDGPVTVAVSTGGTQPGPGFVVARRLAEQSGPGLGELAELLARRASVTARRGPEHREVDWAALLDGPLPALVRAGSSTRPAPSSSRDREPTPPGVTGGLTAAPP